MTGLQLKTEGMQLVLWSEPQMFRDALTAAILCAGSGGRDFTSDDVQAILPTLYPYAWTPNALGAGISAAAKTGVIEATGEYRKTERKSGHARIVAVWRLK